MRNDEPREFRGPADVRVRARTLCEAGWLPEAISLLEQAAAGEFQNDVGIRLDLTKALLAAGRIEEAEAVRLPERAT